MDPDQLKAVKQTLQFKNKNKKQPQKPNGKPHQNAYSPLKNTQRRENPSQKLIAKHESVTQTTKKIDPKQPQKAEVTANQAFQQKKIFLQQEYNLRNAMILIQLVGVIFIGVFVSTSSIWLLVALMAFLVSIISGIILQSHISSDMLFQHLFTSSTSLHILYQKNTNQNEKEQQSVSRYLLNQFQKYEQFFFGACFVGLIAIIIHYLTANLGRTVNFSLNSEVMTMIFQIIQVAAVIIAVYYAYRVVELSSKQKE